MDFGSALAASALKWCREGDDFEKDLKVKKTWKKK